MSPPKNNHNQESFGKTAFHLPPLSDLRLQVLEKIFTVFAAWTARYTFACRKGCAACCTQDVTCTALEGLYILRYLETCKRPDLLVTKLSRKLPAGRPGLTTNEYAKACLNGLEVDPGSGSFTGICPFLENDSCSIYPARPFSCRCFASAEVCRKGASASLPQSYLSAATAVHQIIEHLAQGETWGNLLVVLSLMNEKLERSGNKEQPEGINDPALLLATCRTAQPLPGFLIDQTDFAAVGPLLEKIFREEVNGRKIEDILNGT